MTLRVEKRGQSDVTRSLACLQIHPRSCLECCSEERGTVCCLKVSVGQERVRELLGLLGY